MKGTEECWRASRAEPSGVTNALLCVWDSFEPCLGALGRAACGMKTNLDGLRKEPLSGHERSRRPGEVVAEERPSPRAQGSRAQSCNSGWQDLGEVRSNPQIGWRCGAALGGFTSRVAWPRFPFATLDSASSKFRVVGRCARRCCVLETGER